MKINKAYLKQLIIEQIQLMESSQGDQEFINTLIDIGSQREQTLGRRALPEFRDMPLEDRSGIFRNFAKEKLSPFYGKYILIKDEYGRRKEGPYNIPFDFAFGQIVSFGLADTSNILINVEKVETNGPLQEGSQAQLILSPRFKSLAPPTINLKIDDLFFVGQRRDIEIYDEHGMFGVSISDGVDIRTSDSSNLFSVAQDMGVPMPSSDSEAIEFIREAAYDEEEIDIFYKRIFRNPYFYGSVVGDYLTNLEDQFKEYEQ